MGEMMTIKLLAPYLLFIGEVDDLSHAKTAAGIVDWCPESVAGQFRFPGNPLDLGVPDMDIAQAIAKGVKSIVVGVAPLGGSLSDDWISVLETAAAGGLDVVSGLHTRLDSFPGLVEAARQSGAALINVRSPAPDLPIGNGRNRTGRRLLMVGTDCAVGKKYSALALSKAMNNSGMRATFRATGQTGIMIAGCGVPVDAVVADFLSGAAEVVSPDNDPDHWDVIEGQGSLFHPSYSGVSLGLLHGSQPDAVVVCHDATREVNEDCPGYTIPSIADCIDLNLRCARLTSPDVFCAGVSVNTSGLSLDEKEPYLDNLSRELGLPVVDPILTGCEPIVSLLKESSCVM